MNRTDMVKTKPFKVLICVITATLVFLGGAATYAFASTPTTDKTVGNLTVRTVQTGTSLTTSYQGVLASCPDSSWVAVAGGYYFDYPEPLADDIQVRASQRNEDSNGVEGWLISAKKSGSSSRAIVAEATCIKTHS